MRTRRPASWAAAFAVLGTVIGVWLAFHVPPGLPYDEPAHWSTVLYYAREHRMPVLGDPGVVLRGTDGPGVLRAGRTSGLAGRDSQDDLAPSSPFGSRGSSSSLC